MLRIACVLLAASLSAAPVFAQTPATVEPIAECNIEMSHEALKSLQTMYLRRDWRGLQGTLSRVRERLDPDCPSGSSLPGPDDRILFSWIAPGADAVTRPHSAMQPVNVPYELSLGDTKNADNDGYYEVILADRRGLTVVARVTSEPKENQIVAGATSLLATSAGQIATAVSTVATGLPTTAIPAPTSTATAPVTTPATITIAAAASSAPRPQFDPFNKKEKPRDAPPPPDGTREYEVVIATVRRVTVVHRFGTVKSVRKLSQPKVATEISDEFAKFAKPLARRWVDDDAVAAHLETAAAIAKSSAALCGGMEPDACREALVKKLGELAPRESMSRDVAAADAEVRKFFAELSAASYDEDITLRNDRLYRLGFTTMTGYVAYKSDTAKSRVKTGSGGATDFDPLPSAMVGFGVALAGQPYAKGSNELSFVQRLRFGTGLVALPNLGVFGSVGLAFLPRVSVVAGGAGLYIPTAVTADRADYVRSFAGVGFVGLQVEFP